MTFEKAHQFLLAELDSVYHKIKILHANEDFVNNEAPDWKRIMEEFSNTQDEIFRLKEVWVNVLNLEASE